MLPDDPVPCSHRDLSEADSLVSRIGLGGWLKERKIIPPTGIMKGFV